MLRNYIKVAVRALLRNKLTSVINISGLALAMACSLLIYIFIQDELSYDQYHSNVENIYRVTRSFHSAEGEVNLHLPSVAPPIGPLLKNDFGEIRDMARVINFSSVLSLEEDGRLTMSETEKVFVSEPAILKIFDIEVVNGNPEQSLSRPFTIMLSEKAAMRYFGTLNAIGKRLRSDNKFDIEVTGVFKDFPSQSHWHPEFLISFSTFDDDRVYGRTNLETNWGNNAFTTYLLLEEGVNPAKLESSFPEFLDKHFGSYARTNWDVGADWKASSITTLYLQRLADIHLYSHLDDEIEPNGNIRNVYMMGIIAVFIILIACFNFINLSTARASKRAKEVGLRKVVGAVRTQLVFQYLTESILITTLSLVLALAIALVGLDVLNSFTGKQMTLAVLLQPAFLLVILLFTTIIGILAGIYPAFIVSGFKPALSLKGQLGSVGGKIGLRRVLVVSQFSISIVLIIATFVTFQQLDYLNSAELGYSKDQVITLRAYPEVNESFDAFYNEITRSSAVKNATRSSRIPTGRLLDSYGVAKISDGKNLIASTLDLKTVVVDPEFFPTYDIGIIAGRNFSKSIQTDDSLAFIINDAAAKALGWTNYQSHIDEEFEYANVRGKLIGIVRDFHFESLHQEIVPMIFIGSNNFGFLSIKIAGQKEKEALAHIEKVWKQFLPARPFDYSFLDENYQALYNAEQKQSTLFTVFAGLAIFIASLGLFGLATFNAMQRMKEIGIRKVLGASVGQILGLLSKEIVLLILVSNLLAWPLAWYLMTEWLNTFAYHIDMNLLVYVAAAFVAVMIAMVTVSAQTFNAATSNPARTLKYE